jgi:hypothetical protein
MKYFIPIGLLLGLTHFSSAEIRIPSSVHTIAEIEEAKAEASKESKPLVFVLTDPEST